MTLITEIICHISNMPPVSNKLPSQKMKLLISFWGLNKSFALLL